MSRALITGITGQDGSYLAELLLAKGYEVHGLVRRSSRPERTLLPHLGSASNTPGGRLFLHSAEFEDPSAIRRVLFKTAPDEIYHLAGPSHVGTSFESPEASCQAIGLMTLRLLEILRDLKPPPRFFYASSSEVFGEPAQIPQNELTPMAPVTPYGCAKAFATQMVSIYRKAHGLFACSGILFNHESPRRGDDFVTKKITRAAAAIRLGLQKELVLGDIKAERDWGHARDYVDGYWRTLQHPSPEDFVFATGQMHSVEDVIAQAFSAVGLDWKTYVRHDPSLLRPSEPRRLVGDAAKAKRLLDWEPRATFEELISEMTQGELDTLSRRL